MSPPESGRLSAVLRRAACPGERRRDEGGCGHRGLEEEEGKRANDLDRTAGARRRPATARGGSGNDGAGRG